MTDSGQNSDRVLQPDQFLVCGLGSVGQHCVAILKDFGVVVHAIESVLPGEWEIPQIPDYLTSFVVGDCRHTEMLEQCKIRQCRAVLLVTADERVNIEAGLAARSLNPHVRLVVRSAKENLNYLLGQQLGNYVAFEPTQLSAPAFAFAALNSETIGFFSINQFLFQVVQRWVPAHHRWLNRSGLYDLNTRYRRVLTSHRTLKEEEDGYLQIFHQWEPDKRIELGDRITTIELVQGESQSLIQSPSPRSHTQRLDASVGSVGLKSLSRRIKQLQHLRQHWNTFWNRQPGQTSWWQALGCRVRQVWHDRYQQQIWRVLLLCGFTVLTLMVWGTVLFWFHHPNMNGLEAFYATAVLLLGGYGDLFGAIDQALAIPWALRLFALGLTLAGTAFVGVLYALLTERLLTLRFQFFSPRLPLPERDHVVVIGLGRVGRRVADLLKTFRQPLVVVTDAPFDEALRSQMPIVEGSVNQALTRVNLSTARSLVSVTDAEMDNLEVALMARAANPNTGLVIRTYHRRFRDTVARLFPYTQVLCASELAAEAFAAAAFGENVVGLFRLDHHTIIVTDYQIESGDTLNGLLLAEVAYGYGVVPIYHEREKQQSSTPMPSDDVQLQVGDRMVVLATIQGLKWIEQGKMYPRQWQIWVEHALNADALFEGANEIACISGCSMGVARNLMEQLPALVPVSLYKHQALRLARKLHKVQVVARAIPTPNQSSTQDPAQAANNVEIAWSVAANAASTSSAETIKGGT